MLASAIGAILRQERGGVILCADPDCGWSGFDGPEKCPRCKGPVKPVRKEDDLVRDNKPIEHKATYQIRDCGSYKSYHITYRGQTMRADAWAAKLGIPVAALTVLIDGGKDITPLVRGPEPPAAMGAVPSTDPNEKAKVQSTGEGRGRRYMITFRGKTMSVGGWVVESGCGRSNLLARLAAGLDVTHLLRGEHLPRGPKPKAPPALVAPRIVGVSPDGRQVTVSTVPPELPVASKLDIPDEDPPAVKRVRELLVELDACNDAIAGVQEHLKELQDRKSKLIAQLPGG